MKNIFLLPILFIVFSSFEVKAFTCDIGVIPGLALIDSLYKKDCSAFNTEESFCECILQQNESPMHKGVVKQIESKKGKSLENAKIDETGKMFSVYQKVTLGANTQLVALGVTPQESICTPKLFASGLSARIDKFAEDKAIEKLGFSIAPDDPEVLKLKMAYKSEVVKKAGDGCVSKCSPEDRENIFKSTSKAKAKNNLSELEEQELYLSNSFKKINENAIQAAKTSYVDMPEGFCVSYNDFVAFRGMPSDILMTALRNSKNKADFLNPAKIPVTLEEKEMFKFLGNNPALGRLLVTQESREKLGKSLTLLADKMASVHSPSEKLGPYLDFMRTDVVELLKQNAIDEEAKICLKFAENVAAIQIADKLPESEIMINDNSGIGYFHNAQACFAKKENKKDSFNLKYTLEKNPLFMVYGGKTKHGPGSSHREFGSESDDEYVEYNKENCKGFDDIKTEYIATKCPEGRGQVKCKKELEEKLKTIEGSQELRDRYMASSHASKEVSQTQKALRAKGLGKPVTNSAVADIGKGMTSDKVSRKARKAFETLIKASKDLDIIAKYGEEDKYTESQKRIYDTSGLPSVNSSSAVQVPALADQAVVDPTWVNESETPFSMPQFNSENLSQGASAFLPKNYESLPPEKKVKAVQDVEDSLNKFEVTKLDQVKDLKDEIQDLREELADAKTSAKEEVTQQVAKAPQNNKIPLPSSGGSGAIPSNNPVYLPSSFATGGSMGSFARAQNQAAALNSGSRSDLTKTNSDRDNALLSSKYAGAQKEALRGPASVEGLVVVSNEALSAIPKGVGFSNPLTVTDGQLDQFKGSAEALNKELQSRIKELGLKPGQNKMVEIRSKDSDKKMYLHAVWKDNSWVFHPFSRNVHAEIARTHTLKSLSETLQ